MNTLLIITGAGASHDAADAREIEVEAEFTPPLTTNLFRSGNSQLIKYVKDCLRDNPYAAQVGKDWKPGKQTLEEYLLGLKNSKSLMLRRQYWAVPIYLHELFLTISHRFIRSSMLGVPSNYKSLINAVAKNGNYAQIIWLNLNYDLLADQAIKQSTNNVLNSFSDYMNLETADKIKIKYTKPHGSVDWFRHSKEAIPWIEIKNGRLPDNFEETLSTEIYTEYSAHQAQISPKEFRRYPAISAPLGKYEYVHKGHMEVIIAELKSLKTLSLLCIGFSALDTDILDLIKNNIQHIEKLKIVNGNFAKGKEACLNISRYSNKIDQIERDAAIFSGGFSTFINEEIDEWLAG